jgi:ArsR family metal-binding transcriptional regulator
MKLSAALFFALFGAGVALADPYSMAKQQAKSVANGGPISSQPPPPPQPAPPQNNNPPPDPVLEATTRNVSNLRADFNALNNSTNLDPNAGQKLSLLNNLAAAAQSAKPAAASIKKIASDLIATMTGKEKMRAQQQKLAQEIHAVFNSSHLSAAQQQKIFNDVKKNLEDGGAAPDDAGKVVADLKTIATETK